MPQMHFPAHGSLRLKLFRLVALAAAVALVISLAGALLFEWNNQEKRVRQSLMTIAHAAGVGASAAVAFQDRKAAGEALRILVVLKEIEAAALYPLEGYRLASYGTDVGLPQHVEQVREHLPGFSLFEPTTTLFQPIRLDDATIGYIFIRASLQDPRSSYLLHAAWVIVLNLVGLVLVLSFGQRFLDRIITPIKALAETSRQVRVERNFSLRAAAPAAYVPGDELGELVKNFNAMLTEIEVRDRELASYHKGLERRVAERTGALHTANLKLQEANLKLAELTITDSLTGLANRRHLDEALAAEWARARRTGQSLAILMLDVDWFKKYNDIYGHQMGDECLVDVARELKACARRPGDLAARYGGEEFVLIVTHADTAKAQELAEALCHAVAELARKHSGSIFGTVTVSIGVAARIPEEDMTAEALMKMADAALYRAKESGRNRVELAP